MRWAMAAAGALILGGCGQTAQQPTTNGAGAAANLSEANGAANESTAVPENASEEANASAPTGGVLPAPNAALRFVGTWATNKAECKSKPWHLTTRELTVTGGPHCSFYNVAKVPGGYDVAAQCPDKEPIHTDLIKLRFAESAQAMLVESNAIQPTGLIYCGK